MSHRIAALCAKYDVAETDIRGTIATLREHFGVTEEQAIEAVENMCMQPKCFEERAG